MSVLFSKAVWSICCLKIFGFFSFKKHVFQKICEGNSQFSEFRCCLIEGISAMLRKQNEKWYLPRTGVQPLNGSPVYWSLHLHDGVWLITVHWVLVPHDPSQGSTHLWLMQARLAGHSGFIVHSGRQFGDVPRYVGKHEQAGLSLITLHSAFGPHGVGMHGFCGWIGVSSTCL